MKILAVEDDPVARRILQQALVRLGHEVVEAANGADAVKKLAEHPVRVVVSDWMMPEMDGLQLCHHLRSQMGADYVYFILLTAQSPDVNNQREAIEAGVDDFLTKPLDAQEIWMRLRVAERILRFTTQVRQLEAFLPMCSYCKKVRDDQNYWQGIEHYINERTGTDISHSVCPDCYQRVIIPELHKMHAQAAAANAKPAADASPTDGTQPMAAAKTATGAKAAGNGRAAANGKTTATGKAASNGKAAVSAKSAPKAKSAGKTKPAVPVAVRKPTVSRVGKSR